MRALHVYTRDLEPVALAFNTSLTLFEQDKVRVIEVDGQIIEIPVTETWTVRLDSATRTITWELGNIDLPAGQSDFVMFAVSPLPDLASGTAIRNTATIQFEIQPPLTTNEVINIIDTDVPVCLVDALPSQSPPGFEVSWSGDGDTEIYSIFVSRDGGPFTLHATLDTTSLYFQGVPEARYDFMCIATDLAGNREVQPPLAEASTTPVPANSLPVAQCLDRIVPTDAGVCSAAASVDYASFDPEAGPLTLAQSPAGPYAPGLTHVTLTVTDEEGAADTCSATVTVQDNTDPAIASVSASPQTLWPPNHKMVPVTVSVSASDACDTAPRCRISTVSSNEPTTGLGDGDTAPDWQISGDRKVNLRAERSGTGSGRVYTITVACTDASGNSATQATTVAVPHKVNANNLAALLHARGQHAEAEPLYQRALAIKERLLGPQHADVAMTLSNLAVLYKSLGRYAEAEVLYQRALPVFEQALGPAHPHVETCLRNYARLLRDLQRRSEARALAARARQVRCSRSSITLGVINETCYVLCMIKSFKGEETEKIFRGQFSRKLPQDIQRVAARKLEQLHAATALDTLRIPPGNRLEALTHDRQGQHSIRVNDQWRVCFVWRDGNAYDVEIVDYH